MNAEAADDSGSTNLSPSNESKDAETAGAADAETRQAWRKSRMVEVDTVIRVLQQSGSVDMDAVTRVLQPSGSVDLDAALQALRQLDSVDIDAAIRALSDNSVAKPFSEPEHLASETEIEELPEEVDLESLGSVRPEVPEELTKLLRKFEAQGVNAVITESPGGRFILQFDLKAGRSARSVRINPASASTLMAFDLPSWRSLQRYDGIWSQAEKVVEIALRGDRFGFPLARQLRRRLGVSETDRAELAAPFAIDLMDDPEGVRLQIGTASDVASVLLSPFPTSPPRMITLQIAGVPISSTDEADDLAEKLTDSLSVDFDIAFGISFRPQRLEDRSAFGGRVSRRRLGLPTFPRNNYQHAAVVLYRAGRDRTSPPLIRYWSLYQVLEYFFPKHSQAEALSQLARHLRSPAFDAHRDEDVLKAIELATNARAGSVTEEQQLSTTLRAITSTGELLEVIEKLGLKDHLETRNSELTQNIVRITSTEDLLVQLARRIYDIRCRIVHSKSANQRDSGPGLLPGTHHDDLAAKEVPLMEYLAQQALIVSAEPLILPIRQIER